MKKLFTLLTLTFASIFVLSACTRNIENEAKQQLAKTLTERYGEQIEIKVTKKIYQSDSLCCLYVLTERPYQDDIDSIAYRPYYGNKDSLRVTTAYEYVYINVKRQGKQCREEALSSQGYLETARMPIGINPETARQLESEGYDPIFLSKATLNDIQIRYRDLIENKHHINWDMPDYEDRIKFIAAELQVRCCGRKLP